MPWSYRLVKYADGSGFGVHEVQRDNNCNECSMTESPAAFIGDTAEEVREALMLAKMDVVRRPIFIEPDDWR